MSSETGAGMKVMFDGVCGVAALREGRKSEWIDS